MKSGRLILLDRLLNLVVYGNLLAVYNLFYSLTVGILAGNLSGNGNGVKLSFSLTASAMSPSAILRISFALASVVTILPL